MPSDLIKCTPAILGRYIFSSDDLPRAYTMWHHSHQPRWFLKLKIYGLSLRKHSTFITLVFYHWRYAQILKWTLVWLAWTHEIITKSLPLGKGNSHAFNLKICLKHGKKWDIKIVENNHKQLWKSSAWIFGMMPWQKLSPLGQPPHSQALFLPPPLSYSDI